MTVKEAILKSLEDMPNGATAGNVFKHIVEKHYYEFIKGKTPEATVQAQLGYFITKGDTRVKRMKNSDNVYCYYLSKYENEGRFSFKSIAEPFKKEKNSYLERDLHPLLCTFLKGEDIFPKTIYHEQSKKQPDEYQKWIHPDIIGAKFIKFENKTCQQFFKEINRTNTVEIYSYELKRDINSDYDLKKCFFQAVSNSSWANYGFLVAFDIGSNLLDELKRLNHSFGIGFIQLKANPYESQILFPARYRMIDFKTMEKLCNVNKDFNAFFEQVEKVITADSRFTNDVKQGLELLCDKPFKDEAEIESYCHQKHIPIEESLITE